MADMWMPGAKHVPAWMTSGPMLGGEPRVIWHTTENDPHVTSARTIADYLNRVGYQVHLVWNPVTGELIQMIPADRAGRGVRNSSGGVQTNREGQYCIQIEVVARSNRPFTDGPLKGLGEIMKWIRQFGIPDVWPDGPPLAHNMDGKRSTSVWTHRAGHYGHSQVPENDHTDPGAIDTRKLFGADDMSAGEVWDHEIPVSWGKQGNPAWKAKSILTDIDERLRALEESVATIATAVARLG